jgi:hypothetical protein
MTTNNVKQFSNFFRVCAHSPGLKRSNGDLGSGIQNGSVIFGHYFHLPSEGIGAVVMADNTQTGLRISPEWNEKINAKAKEIGISKNALMLVLMDLGWKAYEKLNLPPQSE